ncbi:MAG: cysteine--tRNA ligase [Chloroflexi bacterium]|nr:cysteine--tRNA ligase [Chloroflexota bacterium]
MTLRISNTLSGTREEFVPRGDIVSMYVCGMTPKFHPHIGHARLFIAADLMRRYLEFRGYRVKHVQNFTDIDDKIIARGQLERISAEQAAKKYTDSYFEAMDALRVQRAHVYPSVTGSMPGIIEFVQALIERGYGYVVEGDVYYDVSRFADYGKLSGRTGEGELAGVRKELEPGKHDPRDFALWKAAKPDEPAWESPWGQGRPGWHIECSTMVRETLGDQIDLHAGGQDLIFPHHENEIAQSEARTGLVPFARYWPHVGLVTTGGEKMSHSLENFTTIQQVIARYDPMALRLFLLSTHYRSPLAFTEEGLLAAERGLERLRTAADGPVAETGEGAWTAVFSEQFQAHMDDDFNSAGALGVLFDLSREVNRRQAVADAEGAADGRATLVRLADTVLGLDLRERKSGANAAAEPFIDLLVETRRKLREARQWALADQIRDALRELGVSLEDRSDGSLWRWSRPEQ